jgi:hypothetical protein
MAWRLGSPNSTVEFTVEHTGRKPREEGDERSERRDAYVQMTVEPRRLVRLDSHQAIVNQNRRRYPKSVLFFWRSRQNPLVSGSHLNRLLPVCWYATVWLHLAMPPPGFAISTLFSDGFRARRLRRGLRLYDGAPRIHSAACCRRVCRTVRNARHQDDQHCVWFSWALPAR